MGVRRVPIRRSCFAQVFTRQSHLVSAGGFLNNITNEQSGEAWTSIGHNSGVFFCQHTIFVLPSAWTHGQSLEYGGQSLAWSFSIGSLPPSGSVDMRRRASVVRSLER